ncbi:MAG TPA: adenylate/guanylate cyclase domain-containing protein [Nitrososphaerales archaeon]|nr:adenylate/guanylate cyclase domain-containing protein [Nitrososphaerales archaeon]
MSGGRRLGAVMFTDMVGFTALTQKSETSAMHLLEEQRKLVRPLFPKWNGREIKSVGDAFLVEFSSALEAVRCGFDIQQTLHELNSNRPLDQKILLRIGIHLGDIIHSDEDVYGDAVNVASRIEPLAEPGGICLTQQVYDHVRNKTELSINRVGSVRVKNVELPIEVYKVVAPWSLESLKEESPPKERLAVLPFVNMSPDPADEFFADGLTEELITKLSQIGGLRVIARTSIMNYKKKEKKAIEIGRELSVGSIIEGSVRKAGNRIRVTVQLIDPRNEEHLWASNYDRELNDVFAIQSDVASKVSDSLLAGVFSGFKRADTKNIEAYTLYLRAMQSYHGGTEQRTRESINLFKRAISIEPTFVRAYAGLALAWIRLEIVSRSDLENIKKEAEPAARKALELGPDFAESHAAMSMVAAAEDRFGESVIEASKAVEINPNLAEAYSSLGLAQSATDTLENTMASFRKAYELDPLSFANGENLAAIAMAPGEKELALEVVMRMKELNPENPATYIALARYYIRDKNFVKAQEAIDQAKKLDPDGTGISLGQGILYAASGRRKEAEEMLHDIMERENEDTRLFAQFMINAILGNLDESFEALMKQAEMHTWDFTIRFHPWFEPLRKDPRYQEFCKKVGIPS